ncbi:hypothetical protein MNBD_NITROSPINAE02-933 [hydrothermal vent metagenome]|uniref:Uncharacterized protein n=1 Tax=hydrothermal vent metagenome TaxID=652676 RepID=A0A3B1CFT2_9ZZZZ
MSEIFYGKTQKHTKSGKTMLSGKLTVNILLALCLGFTSSCATSTSTSHSPVKTIHAASSEKKIAKLDLVDRSQAYTQYLLGLLAEKRGQYKEAVKHYKKAVTYDENLIQSFDRCSTLLLRMGKVEQAASMAKRALKIDPDFIPSLYMLGSISSGNNSPGDAIEYFHRVTKLDPTIKDAWLSLSIAYLKNTQYDEAFNTLEKFKMRFPGDALGLYFTGRALAGLKRIDEAEAAFKELIEQFPRFLKGYEALAYIYRYQKKFDKAAIVYKRYLAIHPGSEEVQKELADIQLRKKSYDKAGEAYDKLISQGAGDINLYFRLGITHWRQAEILGSVEDYKIALDNFQLVRIKDPGNQRVAYYIATIFERLNLTEEAIESWKRLDTGGDDTRDIYLKIAELYEKAGDDKMSLEYAVKASRLSKDDPELYYFAGILQNKLNRGKDAEKSFLKAISLKKDEGKYYFYLGVTYEKMKQFDKSIEAMKSAIDLNPGHANALNYLGYIYAIQGINLDEAEKNLIEALRIDPTNGYFIDSLGWIYYKQKKYKEALNLLEKAIRNIPPDPTVLEHLGDIYIALNDLKSALKAYELSLKSEPEDGRDLEREPVIKKLAEVKEKLMNISGEK